MSIQSSSEKSFITVSEMAEMCRLSRSRFYDLIEAGIFPRPALKSSSNRPIFDRALIDKCMEIRATGIGMNGVPVLFNRKPAQRSSVKRKVQPAPTTPEKQPQNADLLDALKGLGLVTTEQIVSDALVALYPAGVTGIDQGEVIRKVFLHLQKPKR